MLLIRARKRTELREQLRGTRVPGTTEDASATALRTRSVVTALSVKLLFLTPASIVRPAGFCPRRPSEGEGSLLRLLHIPKSTAACHLVPRTDVFSPLYLTTSIGTAPRVIAENDRKVTLGKVKNPFTEKGCRYT